MRRVVALLAFALVVVSVASPAIAASAADTPTPAPASTDTPTPTATPTPQSDNGSSTGASAGPYSLEELRQGGVHDPESPPSIRMLEIDGQTRGAAGVRYQDPTWFEIVSGDEPKWQFLESGTRVTENDVQIYSSAFGGSTGDYTLVVVYWTEETRTVNTPNGTVERAYAEQNVERKQISITEGYSTANVTLKPHYDEAVQVTMWLEKDGEPVPGARWRFEHKSNPKSKAVNINSLAGAWGYTARTAIIPGLAGLILGFLGGTGARRLAGTGPRLGLGVWLIGLLIGGSVVATSAVYQTAVLLDHMPWLIGASFAVPAFGLALMSHPPVRKIGLERDEILDAKTLPGRRTGATADTSRGDPVADGGAAVDANAFLSVLPTTNGSAAVTEDDTRNGLLSALSGTNGTEDATADDDASIIDATRHAEMLYRDLPEIPVVRSGDSHKVPKRGIRPFLARLFGDPATLDLSSFQTRVGVRKGRLDEIIVVDPKSDEVADHEPAQPVRNLAIQNVDEDASIWEQGLAWLVTLVQLLAGPLLGWVVFGSTMGLPGLGFLLGLVVTAVLSYSVEGGHIDFDPAPIHFMEARPTLTAMQNLYRVSAEEESAQETAWRERARTMQEAREHAESEREVVSDTVLGALAGDVNLGTTSEDADSGEGDTDE